MSLYLASSNGNTTLCLQVKFGKAAASSLCHLFGKAENADGLKAAIKCVVASRTDTITSDMQFPVIKREPDGRYLVQIAAPRSLWAAIEQPPFKNPADALQAALISKVRLSRQYANNAYYVVNVTHAPLVDFH